MVSDAALSNKGSEDRPKVPKADETRDPNPSGWCLVRMGDKFREAARRGGCGADAMADLSNDWYAYGCQRKAAEGWFIGDCGTLFDMPEVPEKCGYPNY